MTERRPLRSRQDAAYDEAGLGRGGEPTHPNYPALVGCVFANPTVPTTTGVYYSMHPVDVAGAEAEGGAGTLTVDTSSTFLALVIGNKAPVAGDYQVCRFVENRWVTERYQRSSSGVYLPGCPCATVPSPLTMSVSNPSLNYRIFQAATLTWQSPVPSQFASLALGTGAFLSTASFTDAISTNPFWYYFYCSRGYYALSRVYPRTSSGPAYQDSIRYEWLAGYFGNTCSPFNLNNGAIFSGGNPSTVVTITG